MKAKSFTLKDSDESTVKLADYKGKWLVLYFYPRDNTPGCTTEAIEFTQHLKKFQNAGAEIIGISPDSCSSHAKFMNKHKLGITLLADPNHVVLEKYGAWQKKSMYGKKYMGVQRSTHLIDPKGNVAHSWPKVSVKGHVEEVLKILKEKQ